MWKKLKIQIENYKMYYEKNIDSDVQSQEEIDENNADQSKNNVKLDKRYIAYQNGNNRCMSNNQQR